MKNELGGKGRKRERKGGRAGREEVMAGSAPETQPLPPERESLPNWDWHIGSSGISPSEQHLDFLVGAPNITSIGLAAIWRRAAVYRRATRGERQHQQIDCRDLHEMPSGTLVHTYTAASLPSPLASTERLQDATQASGGTALIEVTTRVIPSDAAPV